MNERVAFGLELRRIRERRGLSLEQMSEQTKVGMAHYAALEAGDLSRWPSGIFRRAFVRSYAAAIGLDPDEVVAQFNRIFPDPADGPRAAARAEAARREEALAEAKEACEPSDELSMFRLALDPPRREYGIDWFRNVAPRLASAAVDVALALAVGALAALAFGWAWYLPTSLFAGFLGHLVYYSLMGSTPGSWVMARVSREFSERLGRFAVRRRPPPDGSTGWRRHRGRRSPSRPASHAHRVQH